MCLVSLYVGISKWRYHKKLLVKSLLEILTTLVSSHRNIRITQSLQKYPGNNKFPPDSSSIPAVLGTWCNLLVFRAKFRCVELPISNLTWSKTDAEAHQLVSILRLYLKEFVGVNRCAFNIWDNVNSLIELDFRHCSYKCLRFEGVFTIRTLFSDWLLKELTLM